jgi:S1-C subfamily serine protease
MVRGQESRIFARYAVEFAELSESRGPTLVGRQAAEEYLLSRCLWIIVAVDKDGYERSATGFSLDGFGIVSCAHIFLDDEAVSFYLVPAWSQGKRYPIRAVRYHKHYDVAQVPSPVRCPASLVRGDSQNLRVSTDLVVGGFPAWAGLVERPRIQHARSAQIRIRSLVRYVLLSGAQLSEGDSGGPVIDHQGRVVAIVYKGMDAPDMPNGCVLAEHLEVLLTVSGPKHVRVWRSANMA